MGLNTLSATLFHSFINDLIYEMNQLNLGIYVSKNRVSLLLYTYDITTVAENKTAVQTLLGNLFN